MRIHKAASGKVILWDLMIDPDEGKTRSDRFQRDPAHVGRVRVPYLGARFPPALKGNREGR